MLRIPKNGIMKCWCLDVMARGSFRKGRFKAEQIRDFAVFFFLSSSFSVVHS